MSKAKDNIKIVQVEDYHKEAVQKFGKNWLDWKFICPICKTIQSGNDFLEIPFPEQEIGKYLGFSCIGRYNGKKVGGMTSKHDGIVGCDYTPGGFFNICKIMLIDKDKKELRPTFELACKKMRYLCRDCPLVFLKNIDDLEEAGLVCPKCGRDDVVLVKDS